MLRVARILPALIYLYCIPAQAQNLVPNPGFEYFNNCPSTRSEIVFSPAYDSFPSVTDWVSPLNVTTPDYYNVCATSAFVAVPYNTYNGYRQPHGGNAYAGISMFTGFPLRPQIDDYREYLQTRLSEPLMQGHTYYISFFVDQTYHLADDFNIISVDKIGLCLTDHKVDTVLDFAHKVLALDIQPQVESPAGVFFTDSSKWVKVHGTYMATGGEQWLTIGYFANAVPVSCRLLHSPVASLDSIHCTAYMYVDDVCVIDMQNVHVHDTTIYSSSFPMVLQAADVHGEYIWNTGGKGSAQLIQFPGTYWRMAWGDCEYAIDTIHVIKQNIDECLWLPNAFTPNNDGLNDKFGPVPHCFTGFYYYDFSIYNRWGQRIFDTDDPEKQWDGRWKGRLQDPNTYFYMLQYTLVAHPGYKSVSAIGNDLHVIKGDFELLR